MNIRNFSIGTRLSAGLGFSIIIMIGLSAVGIGNLSKLNNGTERIASDIVPKVIFAYEAVGGVNDVARAMRNVMLSNDPATVEKELSRIEKKKKEVDHNLAQLSRLFVNDSDIAGNRKFQAIMDARDKYLVVQTAFMRKSEDYSQREETVKFLLNDVRKLQTAYLNALTDLVAHQTQAVNTA